VDAFEDMGDATATCKEIAQGKPGVNVVGVEILACREIITKRGKNPGKRMCFLTVTDNTCIMDNVVCFPEEFAKYGGEIVEENMILLCGEKEKSFIVKRIKRMEK